MYIVVAIIIQMGYDVKDTLKSCWLTAEQFFMPFYTNTVKYDRFFHILRFLNFGDSMNQPDKNDRNHDRL